MYKQRKQYSICNILFKVYYVVTLLRTANILWLWMSLDLQSMFWWVNECQDIIGLCKFSLKHQINHCKPAQISPTWESIHNKTEVQFGSKEPNLATLQGWMVVLEVWDMRGGSRWWLDLALGRVWPCLALMDVLDSAGKHVKNIRLQNISQFSCRVQHCSQGPGTLSFRCESHLAVFLLCGI